jgi:hypothetical protein
MNFFKSEASEARQAVGKLLEGSLWASLEYVGNGFIVIHIFGLVHRDAGITAYLESTTGGKGQSPIGLRPKPFLKRLYGLLLRFNCLIDGGWLVCYLSGLKRV